MNIRTVLLLSFAALLSSLGLTVLAAPPGGHLNISQVLVDDPNDPTSITIVGTDFLFGPEAPTVTLGEYVDPLEIVGVPTNDTIVASLPENLVAGDYLLTVATGTGQSQNDEYDLTIGAVGPRGPQGEQGPEGLQGEQGNKGDKGDKGDPGLPGAPGADGQPGAPGADGADGADGSSCSVTDGDDFATINCDDGSTATVNDGAQGPEGPQGPPGASGEADQNVAGAVCNLYRLTGHELPTYCTVPKLIFVTQMIFKGDLGGLDGADEKCSNAAASAGLDGIFKAWLSTNTVSAASRLNHGYQPYYTTAGTLVANNWQDLTDGTLSAAILYHQFGSPVDTRVPTLAWTGTEANGENSLYYGWQGSDGHCINWVANSDGQSRIAGSHVGSLFATDSEWTNYRRAECYELAHLYCIEQ